MPRVLILDQPSQVYFPSDYKNAGPEPEREADRTSLLQAYQVIAQTVRSVSSGLQVIVMEHADLQDDVFSSAVVERWRQGLGALVPREWINNRAVASPQDGREAAEDLAAQEEVQLYPINGPTKVRQTPSAAATMTSQTAACSDASDNEVTQAEIATNYTGCWLSATPENRSVVACRHHVRYGFLAEMTRRPSTSRDSEPQAQGSATLPVGA